MGELIIWHPNQTEKSEIKSFSKPHMNFCSNLSSIKETRGTRYPEPRQLEKTPAVHYRIRASKAMTNQTFSNKADTETKRNKEKHHASEEVQSFLYFNVKFGEIPVWFRFYTFV